MSFNVFFMSKGKEIPEEDIIEYFQEVQGFTVEVNDECTRLTYTPRDNNYVVEFYVCKKVVIPRLWEIDALYKNTNTYLEINPVTSTYGAAKSISFTKKFMNYFDLVMRSEFLKNVTPYNSADLMQAFDFYKNAMRERQPLLFKDCVSLNKDILNSISRYQGEYSKLQSYYDEECIIVPGYEFYVNENGSIRTLINWEAGTKTVFPPYLAYVRLKISDKSQIVKYAELKLLLERELTDLPGFVKGTDLLEKGDSKKIKKLLKKHEFNRVSERLTQIEFKNIID